MVRFRFHCVQVNHSLWLAYFIVCTGPPPLDSYLGLTIGHLLQYQVVGV